MALSMMRVWLHTPVRVRSKVDETNSEKGGLCDMESLRINFVGAQNFRFDVSVLSQVPSSRPNLAEVRHACDGYALLTQICPMEHKRLVVFVRVGVLHIRDRIGPTASFQQRQAIVLIRPRGVHDSGVFCSTIATYPG